MACVLALPPSLQAQSVWSSTTNLNVDRRSHTATLLEDGRVLVAGGETSSFDDPETLEERSAELYDPATGLWSVTGSFNVDRRFHTATLLEDGRVLAVSAKTAEIYDPTSERWSITGDPIVGRERHTATLLNDGRVLVIGGVGVAEGTAELYDPITESWNMTRPLNLDRRFHTATLLADGLILVAGGEPNGEDPSAELYDPSTDRWSVTGSPNMARNLHTATRLGNGQVLVAKGRSAELYDPSTELWAITGSLNVDRGGHTASLLADGRVLVVGVSTSGGPTSAELYDPFTRCWTATGSLNGRRFTHTATLLEDGRILAAGGFSGEEVYDYVQLLYPQLALGGGFEVVLFVTNQSEQTWNGRADLDAGAWPTDRSWSLDGEERTGQSGFDIMLTPNQTRKFTLSSREEAASSGWLEIEGRRSLTSNLATSFFYNFFIGEGLEDSTGAAVTNQTQSVRFPVERSANVNTGIAVRQSQELISFTLFDEEGQFLQTSILPLEGARFFDQIFAGLPQDFVGSIKIESSKPFFITVLRQELIPGEQLRFQLTSVPATRAP